MDVMGLGGGDGSWVGMGQEVRTSLGHGGITCILQTQFSSWNCFGKGKHISEQNYRKLVMMLGVILESASACLILNKLLSV